MPKRVLFPVAGLLLFTLCSTAQIDTSHYSQAFETERFYRIYLPAGYDTALTTHYPVVYYFHGWGGRYKWDGDDLDYDPEYPGNGRTEPAFVMEWRNYTQNNDVIIVTWDGYEPNLHPGQDHREGIDYGRCDPYDFPRAHDTYVKHWGWDFKMYFRELVAHVDSSFRTIADRDHRGITGLSMGGLTSLYISGQNKDLVSSVSAFCPADNIPQYGPKGHLSVFPVLEMYRSMSGLSMRLTATDGDWLLWNDLQMKRIFEGSGFEPFEFHMADFPEHWAADADLQLDFHKSEFSKKHPRPDQWNHICPSFKTFDQWGYDFTIHREEPAITIFEGISDEHMKVFARNHIPDGPIVTHETIDISTDTIYEASTAYDLMIHNLSSHEFHTRNAISTTEGRLEFSLPGGGHIVGIHGQMMEARPDIRITDMANRDYRYFESGKACSLDLRLVNVGNQDAGNVNIKASSDHPHISFTDDEIIVPDIASGSMVELKEQFSFSFSEFSEEYPAGNIRLEISINGIVADTQKVVFFAAPESPYVEGDDVIVLDGRSQSNVPVFDQGSNSVRQRSLSGGTGNGNGIIEKGEEALIYIRIPQGMAPKDKNTFHKTFLIDNADENNIIVNRLKYEVKAAQAAATSIFSYVSVPDSAAADTLDLWFRLESLYNELNVPERDGRHGGLYKFQYDYRRLRLALPDSTAAVKYNLVIEVSGAGTVVLSPPGGSYISGTDITLTAIPDTGWDFVKWWGELFGSDNPYVLTMDGNVWAIANFDSISTGADSFKEQIALTNYPNPFHDQILISYVLSSECNVDLSVYDLHGKKIKVLKNLVEEPGKHTIIWDGTNEASQPCQPGIYFCMISVSGKSVIEKLFKL